MSFIPVKTTEALKSFEEKSFLGLDRTENCAPGRFLDMQNCSADKYPYLSNRLSRETDGTYNTVYANNVATNIAALGVVRATVPPREDTTPAGFSGVIGTTFYYNGKAKALKVPAVYDTSGNYKYGMLIEPTGTLQLLWANRVIIIHGYNCSGKNPYIYYYNTDKAGTSSDYVESYEYKMPSYYTDRTMSISLSEGSGTLSFSVVQGSSYKGGHYDFKVGDSIFIDEIMKYSDSKWNTLAKTDITSAIVTEYSESFSGASGGNYTWSVKLKVQFYNYLGNSPINSSYSPTITHIYKKIPYMTHLTLHKGRLWGANPNGEYVYASALGELFDFNRFGGLADDSVYLESSSQGGYKGVVSVGEVVASFKPNEMEVIYGELPDEFAVGKRFSNYGCIDMRSCAVIDNVLYFLGNRGFYLWNGSLPQLISKPLDRLYTSAFGFSDGIKYYVSAVTSDGKRENLAYDTRYGLWHKEDAAVITDFFRRDHKSYILVDSAVIKKLESGSEKIQWYAESGRLFFEEYEKNRVNEIQIRAKLSGDSTIEVLVSTDGDDWKSCSVLKSNREIPKLFRVPIRLSEGDFWQFRLQGKGDFLIYGFNLVRDRGGRDFSNERKDV